MILICDDDPAIRSSLQLVLKRAGYTTETVSTPKQAIDFVRQFAPELILMDMNYSHGTDGEEGLTLLSQVKVFRPEVPVILITAWGSIHLAVRGMKAGASDFVTKPWNNLVLLQIIQTAIQLSSRETEIVKNDFSNDTEFEKIIGKSPLLLDVLETVRRIGPTNAPVLITGDSGTGKEMIAEALHDCSHRKNNAFVKVNLGGISQSLFESEMFGHKKGAFTDAHYDRTGRFELADKGTIFLDEIGELEPGCQVKLLRVLQDHTFEVLGDSRQRKVDVRIVSATNKSLEEMVAQGSFREDLFYRINLITLKLPSLRERIEDIPLLARHFARLMAGIHHSTPATFTSDALQYLQKLPFPGNIRQLKNLIDRTILISGKEILTEEDIKLHYSALPGTEAGRENTSIYPLDEMERTMILKAMDVYKGNLSKVSLALGVSRQSLYRRLEKYGIITDSKNE